MKDRGYVQVSLRNKHYLGRRKIGAEDIQIIAEFTNPADLTNVVTALNGDIVARMVASEMALGAVR